MREQRQFVFHLTKEEHIPIARSSYSGALNSEDRATIVQQVVEELAVSVKKKSYDTWKQANHPIFLKNAS